MKSIASNLKNVDAIVFSVLDKTYLVECLAGVIFPTLVLSSYNIVHLFPLDYREYSRTSVFLLWGGERRVGSSHREDSFWLMGLHSKWCPLQHSIQVSQKCLGAGQVS